MGAFSLWHWIIAAVPLAIFVKLVFVVGRSLVNTSSLTKAEAAKLTGVGGWLLFYIILQTTTAVGALIALFKLENAENIFASSYQIYAIGLALVLIAHLISNFLLISKNKAGVTLAISTLYAHSALGVAFFVITQHLISELGHVATHRGSEFYVLQKEALGAIVGPAIWALIWHAYFRKSKRIQLTYFETGAVSTDDRQTTMAGSQTAAGSATQAPAAPQTKQPQITSNPPTQATTPSDTAQSNTELLPYYEIALKEAENEAERVSGVWAMAFANADGDEQRAKAEYIKLRVPLIIEEKEATSGYRSGIRKKADAGAETTTGNNVKTYRGFAMHRVASGWVVPDLKFGDPKRVYGTIILVRHAIDREIKFISP